MEHTFTYRELQSIAHVVWLESQTAHREATADLFTRLGEAIAELQTAGTVTLTQLIGGRG